MTDRRQPDKEPYCEGLENTAMRPEVCVPAAPGLPADARFSDRLHALSFVRCQTVGATSLPSRAQEMAEQLRSIFAMDACVIRLLDGDDLVLLACAGLPEGSCSQHIPVSCGIATEILKRRSPLFLADVMSHPVLAAERAGIPGPPPFISYAGAPMLAGDRVIGVLAILSRTRRDDLTQADMDCIQLMANNVSVAIENDRLYARLLHEHKNLESEMATRRQAEDEVRQLREDLAKRSRISAMGELTVTIAHELNQPLGAIITNAQACQRLLNRTEPDLEEVQAALSEMIADGSRAHEVVGRVRRFLQRGGPAREPVDLNAVVSAIVPLLKTRLAKDHVALSVDLAEALPPVSGDFAQLQQLILNLVVNAADAVALLSEDSREIRISSGLLPDGTVSVAVEDSGIGISGEDMSRLFQPFFTTKPDGMGMGLPICKSIIEAHGGRLWAESNGRTGSVFQFAIPAVGGCPT